MKLIWIIHLALAVGVSFTGQPCRYLECITGYHPLVCPDGRNIENYNGTVSISDTGIPCRKWSEIDPTRLSHLFREATQGPPNNYCSYIFGEVKCVGYWSRDYQGLLGCVRSICGVENFADVYYGGFVTSASGWLAAKNPDVKGCHWVLQAPVGIVIEIFETKETIQNTFCGNVTPTVRSKSHELFIKYYSGFYAWRNERFNLTYLHILQGFFNPETVTANSTTDGRTSSAKADTSTVNLTSSSSQQASSDNGISSTTATRARLISDVTKETESNGCSAVKSTLLVLCPLKTLIVLRKVIKVHWED